MNAQGSVFQGLIYNLLQQPRSDGERGLVLCFTSAQPGEGVTYVVRALANDVGSHSPGRVARVDLAYLQNRALPPGDSPRSMLSTSSQIARDNKEEEIDRAKPNLPAIWHGSRQYRRDRINELRLQFDYVLIDCPSLRTNGDVLGIAPLVDGVLLVVEANRTRADQILYAERQIQASGGIFRGHILNKRKYFIPQWLYQRLSQN